MKKMITGIRALAIYAAKCGWFEDNVFSLPRGDARTMGLTTDPNNGSTVTGAAIYSLKVLEIAPLRKGGKPGFMLMTQAEVKDMQPYIGTPEAPKVKHEVHSLNAGMVSYAPILDEILAAEAAKIKKLEDAKILEAQRRKAIGAIQLRSFETWFNGEALVRALNPKGEDSFVSTRLDLTRIPLLFGSLDPKQVSIAATNFQFYLEAAEADFEKNKEAIFAADNPWRAYQAWEKGFIDNPVRPDGKSVQKPYINGITIAATFFDHEMNRNNPERIYKRRGLVYVAFRDEDKALMEELHGSFMKVLDDRKLTGVLFASLAKIILCEYVWQVARRAEYRLIGEKNRREVQAKQANMRQLKGRLPADVLAAMGENGITVTSDADDDQPGATS